MQQAITLSRLEEEMQLEEWGYVEGGHDVDEADIRVSFLGPFYLISQSTGSFLEGLKPLINMTCHSFRSLDHTLLSTVS